MRTPSGDLITGYDLHMAEAAGDTKYDFLVTEVSDKIIKCVELLQENNQIDCTLSLREVYNKYLHPAVIDTKNPEIWKHLAAGDVLDVFQFNEASGLAIAKKMKPNNPTEMVLANSMMRLMSEPGVESQQDRFCRIKADGIQVFEQEMINHNLPDSMRKSMHKYCDESYGCVPLQEQMMEILMDKSIAQFTFPEADAARKIVGKKKMQQIPGLRKQFYSHFNNQQEADYIWNTAIRPQLG